MKKKPKSYLTSKHLIVAILINVIILIAYTYFYLSPKIEKVRLFAYSMADIVSNYRDALECLKSTTLRKPSYNAQGCLLFLPDGSAYVPVLFKDENTLKEHQSDVQWEDNLKGEEWKGYYDFKRIFVPSE